MQRSTRESLENELMYAQIQLANSETQEERDYWIGVIDELQKRLKNFAGIAMGNMQYAGGNVGNGRLPFIPHSYQDTYQDTYQDLVHYPQALHSLARSTTLK